MIDDQEAEIQRLRLLLAEANQTIRKQERQIAQHGKRSSACRTVIIAAREVIKWAENSGAGYDIGRKPVEDLRKALEGIQKLT